MTREKVEKYILETYGAEPEYLWRKFPKYAVYRHFNNRKWFAVVMDISKRKLGLDSDDITDIINVKCDPLLTGSLLGVQGFYPAYHMNKTSWITIMPDDGIEEEQIKWLIDMSYDLTNTKKKINGRN